jgi:peroxiredoxin family protein
LRGVRRPGLPSAVDLFGLTRDDFIGQVKDIITVGEFYDLAAGGQIIFT